MPSPASISTSWPAELTVTLGPRANRTRILEMAHRGPLRVQRAFHPEADGTAHMVVLHPPAGLVGGDVLDVRITLRAGASALVTSTGAAKVYRTAGRSASTHTTLTVPAGATLEHVPQEAVIYNGADAHLDTRVRLEAGARFLGWEVVCLGRPACGETFDRGALRLSLSVERDGVPVFLERGRVEAGGRVLDAAWGLASAPAFGTMVATEGDIASLRETLTGFDAGVTRVSGLVVVRARGRDGSFVRNVLERARDRVRDSWGRARVTPAIWRS